MKFLRAIGWGLAAPFLVGLIVILFIPIILVLRTWQEYEKTTNGHPIHWLRAKYGWGKPPSELAKRLGIPLEELLLVEPDYIESFIPKRSGGSRRLLVPSDELKAFQQRILRRVLAKLNSHPACTGFETGKSIVDNANSHVGQAVVLKMDIVDFFPSTSADRVQKYFQRVGWNREAAALLAKLTTYEGGLPQGAPTSPKLSNLVNRKLDTRLDWAARSRKATYSRYADDITISFATDRPKRVRGMQQYIRRRLKKEGYENNRDKELILRKHQQQRVTGLVVNKKVNVPRATRRKLRAIEHRLNSGRSATMTREQLDGWKALLRMVEEQRDLE